MEGTWRVHGGDIYSPSHYSSHHLIIDRAAVAYLSRGVECPWSALGGLVLRMVSPHLSHSYTPPCAAANPNAAKQCTTHTEDAPTHTHLHIPGSQSCNNKQTCIGCTSSVTYTQS